MNRATLLLALLGTTHASAKSEPAASGVERSFMNLSVSPGQDFYEYANGACDKVPNPAAKVLAAAKLGGLAKTGPPNHSESVNLCNSSQ